MNQVAKELPPDWREWYDYVVNEATDLYHDTLHDSTHCRTCEHAKRFQKDFDCEVPNLIMCPVVRLNTDQLTGRLEIALRENTFD